MTIQDWGAVGDMIGGVAVVASLIYLAIQIRQNTQQIARSVEASKLAAFERNVESANRMRELFIVHPEVAEIFLKGLGSDDALKGMDRFRFSMVMRNTLTAFQAAYLRHLSIGGKPEEFDTTARIIDSIIENPGARDWLSRNETDWRPEFRTFIEERLRAIDEAD